MSDIQRILFIDAYDSFTRNIVAFLYRSIPCAEVTIIHIDTDIRAEFGLDLESFISHFDAVVLGPGPGDPRNPDDLGLFRQALAAAAKYSVPILGICLGFQALCLQYGHAIVRMQMPCHGQTKKISTTAGDIFRDLSYGSTFNAISYNSLAVRAISFAYNSEQLVPSETCSRSGVLPEPLSQPSCGLQNCCQLRLLAWDDDGYAMAIQHEFLPLWGLQFHPESCMSFDGETIVQNWWTEASTFSQKQKRVVDRKHSISILDRALHRQSLAKRLTQKKPTESGEVLWEMIKLRRLTSQHLSQFCYETNGKSPKAMLESISKGRYCIYGFPDATSEIIYYANGKLTSVVDQSISSEKAMKPCEALKAVEKRSTTRKCISGCPTIPFWGGWMGFLSYEIGLDLLNIVAEEERIVPDFSFVFIDRSVVLDQKTGNVCIQSIRHNDELWISDMKGKLRELNDSVGGTKNPAEWMICEKILANGQIALPKHDDYQDSFRKCNQHLHAGNSYELCLTTEGLVDLDGSKSDTSYLLYQNLIRHNPVPFAAYLHFPSRAGERNGTTILSTSPEQFLSCSRTGTMDMIPMKGTVQRTWATSLEDAYRILHTPKESAENLMIADLIRHDLYSVVGCKPHTLPQPSIEPNKADGHWLFRRGSKLGLEDVNERVPNKTSLQRRSQHPVSVLAINVVKPFETVYQLVSHIRAHPPLDLNHKDPAAIIAHNHSALQHVLPPGSMTGAPKKRSCEILQQLERRNRGIYSGIIGYMDVGGGCCWNVSIRTAWSSEKEDYVSDKPLSVSDSEDSDGEGIVEVEKRKIWHIGAGGAITVLSNVEGEWEEMVGKMGNVLKGFREVKKDYPFWRPE